jgi:hypothetical protein
MLYKIIARNKKHFYESDLTFERGWKLHSSGSLYSDVAAFKLTKRMKWKKIRLALVNVRTKRRLPEFIQGSNAHILDAFLSGTLDAKRK